MAISSACSRACATLGTLLVVLSTAVLLCLGRVLRCAVLHLILMDAILVQIEVHRFVLLLLLLSVVHGVMQTWI